MSARLHVADRRDLADWRDLAACQGANTDDFFPEKGNSGIKEPKQVCAGCLVKTPCLREALDNDELGIWGGTSEHERRQIKREQVKAA